MKFRETVVRYFAVDEALGDDAHDLASGVEAGIGEGAHEADACSSVDEADLILGEKLAEGMGCVRVRGAAAGAGAAKDAHRLDHGACGG